MRDEYDYPEDLDSLALGFNRTKTNTRCSLYKQRADYPPELLLQQNTPIRPTGKTEILYPGEEGTLSYTQMQWYMIGVRAFLASNVLRRPTLAYPAT